MNWLQVLMGVDQVRCSDCHGSRHDLHAEGCVESLVENTADFGSSLANGSGCTEIDLEVSNLARGSC